MDSWTPKTRPKNIEKVQRVIRGEKSGKTRQDWEKLLTIRAYASPKEGWNQICKSKRFLLTYHTLRKCPIEPIVKGGVRCLGSKIGMKSDWFESY